MFLFSLTFVLVFVCGSEAVDLPNVGSCTFMEYFCDALKCNTDFIKKLQKDPKGDCSAKYKQMFDCVIGTVKICMGDALPESTLNSIVQQSYNEQGMCFEGALEIPTVPPSTGSSLCTNSFSGDANNCLRTFHQKFAIDKSDPSLCTEQAKAKKCLKGVISSECNFPTLVKEILKLGYSDYNPYCTNNRDPGATGNGLCYGVRDLNNPLNSAAGTGLKSGVLQSVLLLYVLLMLFVKD